MQLPKLYEIVSEKGCLLGIESTLEEAANFLLHHRFDCIVVEENDRYFSVSVFDLLDLIVRHGDCALPLSRFSLVEVPVLYTHYSVLDAMHYINSGHELIALKDKEDNYYGVVTHDEVLASIDPKTLLGIYRIGNFIRIKKRDRWVSKDAIAEDIFKDMIAYRHDTVIVVEDHKPIGIVTIRDVLRHYLSAKPLRTKIETMMSAPVVTLPQDLTLKEVLAFMDEKRFRRLVTVNDQGKIVGTVTYKELTSISYIRWSQLIDVYHHELQESNRQLKQEKSNYEYIASIDPLTGIYNRNRFYTLFENHQKRKEHLSLMIMDLDHFKKINDTYGHNSGDLVLKAVAKTLLATLRSDDVVCRWGGEEFVVLLGSVTCDHAPLVAEKIREAIRGIEIEGLPGVTTSIGVTKVYKEERLEETVARADKALYKAKENGRDRVEYACSLEEKRV